MLIFVWRSADQGCPRLRPSFGALVSLPDLPLSASAQVQIFAESWTFTIDLEIRVL
jgi:hypothetical protein